MHIAYRQHDGYTGLCAPFYRFAIWQNKGNNGHHYWANNTSHTTIDAGRAKSSINYDAWIGDKPNQRSNGNFYNGKQTDTGSNISSFHSKDRKSTRLNSS